MELMACEDGGWVHVFAPLNSVLIAMCSLLFVLEAQVCVINKLAS